MKIVFIANQLRRSGPVNVLRDIIAPIDKVKHQVYIIRLMKDDIDRSIMPVFKELGANIVECNFSFMQLELQTSRVAKIIDATIKDINPDVINTHGYHPALIASYLNGITPRINTLHNISIEDYTLTYGQIQGRYMHHRYIKALNKLDGAIAISDTVQRYYDNIIDTPIKRIYNGVDLSLYNVPDKQLKLQIREKNEIPGNALIFIVVGAISRRKNPDMVVKSFVDAFKDVNNVYLVFIGKGKLLDDCQKLSKNNNSIRFLGYRFDVNELIQMSDYSICASSSEGFGLNFIESTLVGVPVISSKIGPFCEFSSLSPTLKDLQFDTNNQKELTQRLTQVYNDHNFSHRIDIDKFRQEFSSESMSTQYIQYFESVVK